MKLEQNLARWFGSVSVEIPKSRTTLLLFSNAWMIKGDWLKVLGQPVTSEVRSSAEKWRKHVIADNFASDEARAKFKRSACSLRRVEHVTFVFECPWMIFRGHKL